MKPTVLVVGARELERLVVVLRIAKGECGESVPGRERLEARHISKPVVLDCRVTLEIDLLGAECFLFTVGAVERIDIREEFLRVGLLDLPGRITNDRVEARTGTSEYVGELQLPVKEAVLLT